jgi:cold shock CspA family protein
MAEGRIKWYSHQLGHGFIICEDPLGDVFVRGEDIMDSDPWSLGTGDKVTFEVVAAPEGKEARTVSKAFPREQLRGDREEDSGVGSRSSR